MSRRSSRRRVLVAGGVAALSAAALITGLASAVEGGREYPTRTSLLAVPLGPERALYKGEVKSGGPEECVENRLVQIFDVTQEGRDVPPTLIAKETRTEPDGDYSVSGRRVDDGRTIQARVSERKGREQGQNYVCAADQSNRVEFRSDVWLSQVSLRVAVPFSPEGAIYSGRMKSEGKPACDSRRVHIFDVTRDPDIQVAATHTITEGENYGRYVVNGRRVADGDKLRAVTIDEQLPDGVCKGDRSPVVHFPHREEG